MMKAGSILLAVSVLAPQCGCASIVHGGKQNIGIFSTPTDAHVLIDNIPWANTPLHADLERRSDHVIAISLDGYEPYDAVIESRLSGWVWGNIIIGGGLGLIVDLITGSIKELYPENVHAKLVQLQES